MTTTALVVEILIAGLEAALWLGVLTFAIACPQGGCVSRLADQYKDWSTMLTVLLLAGGYALGVLVDRIAESSYRWFESTRAGKASNWYCGEGSHWYRLPAPIQEMRLTVLKDGCCRRCKTDPGLPIEN
jgi:hypothetical protein